MEKEKRGTETADLGRREVEEVVAAVPIAKAGGAEVLEEAHADPDLRVLKPIVDLARGNLQQFLLPEHCIIERQHFFNLLLHINNYQNLNIIFDKIFYLFIELWWIINLLFAERIEEKPLKSIIVIRKIFFTILSLNAMLKWVRSN